MLTATPLSDKMSSAMEESEDVEFAFPATIATSQEPHTISSSGPFSLSIRT